MNHIALRGKATSVAKTQTVKSKENIQTEMTTITIIAPVQGAPKIECHVELRSCDPKVTRVMQAISAGDQVEAVGSLATEITWKRNPKTGKTEREPKFYYIFADQGEKIKEKRRIKKMFKTDTSTIAGSSKARDATTAWELKSRGRDIVRRDIPIADYQILGLPGGLKVEKKADLPELMKS